MVEQLTHNPKIEGSNRATSTGREKMLKNMFQDGWFISSKISIQGILKGEVSLYC